MNAILFPLRDQPKQLLFLHWESGYVIKNSIRNQEDPSYLFPDIFFFFLIDICSFFTPSPETVYCNGAFSSVLYIFLIFVTV